MLRSDTIGINNFKDLILDLWRSLNLPGPSPEIECFQMVGTPRLGIQVSSAQFKTVEEFVDEAWEKTHER